MGGGGFGADVAEELLMRWLELGIFTPLMRNHSAWGARRQEVYRFTQTESFRRIIELRYVLLPYIYSEYMKAVRFSGLGDRKEEVLEKGHHYMDIALDEVVFFVRPDHLVLMSGGGQYVQASE